MNTATVEFMEYDNYAQEWQTLHVEPVRNFEEAALYLAELMWEAHKSMVMVLEYDKAFREARERVVCPCGNPKCSNVLLAVPNIMGGMSAIVYVPAP